MRRRVFASVRAFALAKALVGLAAGWALGGMIQTAWEMERGENAAEVSARSRKSERGEYGGDLDFLRRHYVAPRAPGESNHAFDLWSPGALPALLRVNGLTNNRALFIDSHGRAGFPARGQGYGLYPRETLLPPGEPTPNFSAGDFAAVLGKTRAAAIHNIVIAGCNEEGQLRSAEWRRHFVNATNVTYMTPGKLSFKPMFYQAIITPSAAIEPLYGKVSRSSERVQCDIYKTPDPGTEPLGTYVADLYLPGARSPFRTQRAGRELIEPTRGRRASDRAN